jgi:hypothetical protein
MNWYIENSVELAGLFYTCFLLSRLFEKMFHADLSYDPTESHSLITEKDERNN